MATWTYEIINPTPIANVLVERGYADGVHKIYRLSAVSGFLLHDKEYDMPILDESTFEETGEVILGYTAGTVSCWNNYDFATNPREFYAVPETEVPADQIFGGGNDHEIM